MSSASPPPPQESANASPAVEVDPGVVPGEEIDPADSAVGVSSIESTASLTESILAYRVLQGRRYQSSKTTEYWAPNDEQQNEGLDILHNGFTMLLSDRLFLAPIGDKPERVLDVATGTGIWAIDVADQFPGAEVTGTDISPIQPPWVPPNLKFVIDDLNLEWTWPENHFDYIHLRVLYGCVADWGELYRKTFRHLKPGGWVESMEMDTKLESDHIQFREQEALDGWAELFVQAGEKMGRSFAISQGHTMKDLMEGAGFVDIVERKIKMPIGSWPKDPKLQQAGLLIKYALEQSLEGLPMFIGTQVMGWAPEEISVLVAKVRKEVKTKSNCSYVTTTIVYGRKPE
ncbi:Methyltransferase domain-containing protein [Pleurostoma richardsiae]|uniref:Methyltransferase domain-containing protein n=1 Tax=Pleurostoma richardsiae TaxID=41990 RepID=A0AA38R5H7_9PEZI|nr:Methyltransferase domain-containing protein [Pleurostoma richardsiae]